MTRRTRSLAGYAAGALLALGAFRMAIRMADGGAPWPASLLALATGLALVILMIRRIRNGKRRGRA